MKNLTKVSVCIFSFTLLVCSNLYIFGQNTNAAPEEKKPPIPTATAPIGKTEESVKPSKPQDAPSSKPQNKSEPNYNVAPPTPPDFDPSQYDIPQFSQEIERISPKERKRRLDEANKLANELNRQEDEKAAREQQLQDQYSQPYIPDDYSIQPEIRQYPLDQQQNEQSEVQTKRQAAEAAKTDNEMKWLFGLLFLFEFPQIIALAVVAFRTGKAKKSVIAMLIGCATLLFVFLSHKFPNLSLGMFTAIAGFLGIDAFVVGKLAACVIVSQIPKTLPLKLLTAFGIGLSLIVLYQLIGVGSYGIYFGFAVIIIGGIVALVKSTKSETDDLHGSAKFAEKKDFKEFENVAEPGSFILAAAHPDGKHGKIVLPRSLSVMHGLILGGSGTGKSRGFLMPNLAEVKNTSLVVTDPKSELWKYTSGFHDKSVRYAPTEPEASQCFNWIPLCTDARMSELCARALMTAGNTGNTDQFWIDAETAFLSAIFAHTATMKYPTPLTAYRLFTRQKPELLQEQLLHSQSYVAREQAMIFEQTDARIKGAIVPAIAARLQFMRDPSIQLFTSSQLEAPNFGQLRRTPTAVYWCLREQDIARLRPLTSLFFTVLLEQIAGEEFADSENAVPVTGMLDEFANIGKIPDFEITQSLARGRGVALWLGIQSLSQLNQIYGNHAAQTIMSSCATKIALHGLDYQTAEYISKSLGEQTISHSSSSLNVGLGTASIGSSAAKHRRPLLTPDEVTRIGEDEAIVRTSNKYPMRLYKGYYDEKPNTFPVTQSLTNLYVEENEVAEDLIL